MNEEQHAIAEAALAASAAKILQEAGTSPPDYQRKLMEPLQDRYEQLMGFALNPNYKLTALENLAAARELIDTAYVLGAIDPTPWKAYVIETNLAKQQVIAAERQRGIDARSRR